MLPALLEKRLSSSRCAADNAGFYAQQRASLAIRRSKKLLERQNAKVNQRLLFTL